MLRIFISYAIEDDQFVDKLAHDLDSVKHVKLWIYKRDVTIGENNFKRINQGIEESNFFIPIFSKHFLESEWCQLELEAAVTKQMESREKKYMFPVKIDDCNLPLLLRGKRYADFSNWENDDSKYSHSLKELISAMFPEILPFTPES